MRRPTRFRGGRDGEELPAPRDPLRRLVAALERLPGIGPRSADRIVFHLLSVKRDEVLALAEMIRKVCTDLHPCKECFCVTEETLCAICSDPGRDRSLLCVVEQPKDVVSIEQTRQYHGLYHVLMGRLSPQDGIEPEHLTVAPLLKRAGSMREVILATGADLEGDGTALYLAKRLAPSGVRVTRIARGIPPGAALDYVHEKILAEALLERRPFGGPPHPPVTGLAPSEPTDTTSRRVEGPAPSESTRRVEGVTRAEWVVLLSVIALCAVVLLTEWGMRLKLWLVGAWA
ncbi:MAG: recombination protein RecR [Planctomycetes bacterium]|nr:recombination protein RecR [Planctomycetota bacterium]